MRQPSRKNEVPNVTKPATVAPQRNRKTRQAHFGIQSNGIEISSILGIRFPFHPWSSSKLSWRRAKCLNNHHPIIVPNNKQKSGKKKWDHEEKMSNGSQCPHPHADCLVRSVLAQCITDWMPWFSHYVVNAVCIMDAWKGGTGGGSIRCLSVGCHRTCSFGTSKPVSGELSRSCWSTRATKRSTVSHATSG